MVENSSVRTDSDNPELPIKTTGFSLRPNFRKYFFCAFFLNIYKIITVVEGII